jgi:hypothetical protein
METHRVGVKSRVLTGGNPSTKKFVSNAFALESLVSHGADIALNCQNGAAAF